MPMKSDIEQAVSDAFRRFVDPHCEPLLVNADQKRTRFVKSNYDYAAIEAVRRELPLRELKVDFGKYPSGVATGVAFADAYDPRSGYVVYLPLELIEENTLTSPKPDILSQLVAQFMVGICGDIKKGHL